MSILVHPWHNLIWRQRHLRHDLLSDVDHELIVRASQVRDKVWFNSPLALLARRAFKSHENINNTVVIKMQLFRQQACVYPWKLQWTAG